MSGALCIDTSSSSLSYSRYDQQTYRWLFSLKMQILKKYFVLLSSNFPEERVAPKDQACTKVLPHKKRTNTYTKTCIYCSYCKYNTKKLQGKTNTHTYFVKKEYLRKLMVYYKGKIERECCLVHEALRHWKQQKWKTEMEN